MRDMMRELDARLVMRTAEARDHFCQFCEQHGLVVADQRHPGNGVTASWREEIGEADTPGKQLVIELGAPVYLAHVWEPRVPRAATPG